MHGCSLQKDCRVCISQDITIPRKIKRTEQNSKGWKQTCSSNRWNEKRRGGSGEGVGVEGEGA